MIGSCLAIMHLIDRKRSNWCLVLKFDEDFIEVLSECRIRSSRLTEFGGKGERSENRLEPTIDIDFGIYSKVGDPGLAVNFDTIV
jgi:hypothetical protein